MEVALVQLLAFLSIFFLVTGVNGLLRARNQAAPSETVAKPGVFEWLRQEIDTVGAVLEPTVNRAFPEQVETIRNNLLVASLADRLTVRDLRGAQGLLGLSLLVLGLLGMFLATFNLPLAILSGLGLALLGWFYPTNLWLAGIARRRQDDISRALPYAIDLLTVAMQAGQDFGAAVRLLVNEGPKGPLRQEFGIMLRQAELGKSRVEALKDLDRRVQLPELRSCVSAIVQGTEMGASIAETLKLQAVEVRRNRHNRAERKAARAPSIMLIPIALFILPAVFIVIFTPVIIRITSVMGSGE